jgi:hypothetical protein
MEKPKYRWVEHLVDSEAKAMGTYLALLHLLLTYGSQDFRDRLSGDSILEEVGFRSLFTNYLAGKAVDAKQALEAAKEFVNNLFLYEKALKGDERYRILCEIELEFYESFVKAFKKYLRLNQVPEELKKRIKEFLSYMRLGGKKGAILLTPSGTFVFYNELDVIKEWEEKSGLQGEDAKRLIFYLKKSGLVVDHPIVDARPVLPSPCLSNEVIELLVKPFEKIERIGARTFLVIEGDKKLVKKCFKGLSQDVLDDVLSGVNNWLLLREVEGVQRLSKFDVEEMCVFAEYVEGRNLREYIAEKGGVLSEEEAVSLCLRIAKVLKRALDLGIVHRDLKPENVILSKKGEVVVVDWEFSAKLGTKPKALVGTIPYTPPEGREGLISKKYDVYSLGVMLHEMLTGKLPGTTLTLKNKDLEKLLERMIFLDPEKRAEIDEVIMSLSQLCSTISRLE